MRNPGLIALFKTQDDGEEPTEPNLAILQTNLIGLALTSRLATYYFKRQPENSERERCLVLISSLAGYLDQPGSPQYNMAKFGARAYMRCLRRTSWQDGVRVNVIAPW